MKEQRWNYELENMEELLGGHNLGWTTPNKNVKVILVNPEDCKERITLSMIAKSWEGTGHKQWEVLLAGWFIKAVLEALDQNKKEADISLLFNRDFLAEGKYFSKKEVWEHLVRKNFDVVSKDYIKNEFKLKFRV